MMLDATAGNRMIWPNKNPPNVVFLDREIRLAIPPNVFADFRWLPFRDNVFSCVLFDPPHKITRNPQPWFNDPARHKAEEQKPDAKWGKSALAWYGFYKTKREMLTSIHSAQKEFARVSSRLCFKWSEISLSLWKMLPFFDEWNEIQRIERKHKYGKIPHQWVTFLRSSLSRTNEV